MLLHVINIINMQLNKKELIKWLVPCQVKFWMYENENILSNQDRVIKISGIACFHKYSCSTNVLLLDQTECNEQNCYTHGQSDPFPTQRDICYQPNWPHFILICTKWIILIKRLNSLSFYIVKSLLFVLCHNIGN